MSQRLEGERPTLKQDAHHAMVFVGVALAVLTPLAGAFALGEIHGQDDGRQQQCQTLKDEGVVIPTATTASADRGRRVVSVDVCGQQQYEETPAPSYPYYPLGGW